MDIKFNGSGASAKAVLYYITDYITKSRLKANVAYAALELSVRKLTEFDPKEDDLTLRAKQLLQKCAYSMMTKQELSGQEVVMHLMEYEDHFMSHSFRPLFWTSSLVNDYIYRGTKLQNYSLWDYVSCVGKVTKKKRYKKRGLSDKHNVNDGDDFSQELGAENEVFDETQSKIMFMERHPECHTHFQQVFLDSARLVPVPLGPSIPRRDRPQLYERYCRLMLIFFKPWVTASDLCGKGEKWSHAFDTFFGKTSVWQSRLDNMQILHECRDSRDDHFECRRRGA
ncbi:hypothetical protein EV421DRAFT_1722283, partial [Armillaria borealis]